MSLAFAWILTCLVLVKGVKGRNFVGNFKNKKLNLVMGKISMFTATIPYVIIVLMFIRGVTLPGASLGLDFYLFKPDMSAIYDKDTWRRGFKFIRNFKSLV